MTEFSTVGPLSVCIPAHNEAATIGRLLVELRSPGFAEVREILVCANGCTDGTEDVVKRLSETDSRIRLMESARGKPAAWNALVQAARSEVILFLDADVAVAPDFLPALVDALARNPEASILAARDIPMADGRGWRTRLVALANRPFFSDYLCGRAYVVRTQRLEALLAGCQVKPPGPDGIGMPLDLLHEDLWLEMVAGRSRLAFAPAAKVYYDAGTVLDLIRSRARLRVARRQLARVSPAMFQRWLAESGRHTPPLRRVWRSLAAFDGPRDFLASATGTLLRACILLLNASRMRSMETLIENQLSTDGGHEALAGTGRLSKGPARTRSAGEL